MGAGGTWEPDSVRVSAAPGRPSPTMRGLVCLDVRACRARDSISRRAKQAHLVVRALRWPTEGVGEPGYGRARLSRRAKSARTCAEPCGGRERPVGSDAGPRDGALHFHQLPVRG